KRRYAALFLPQIGHYPIIDVKGSIPPEDKVGRMQAIVALEDSWLGELMKQLEEAGTLDHTLIVLTGDHGARMVGEFPRLEPGMIQDSTFHVPFLLYAPTVLTSRHEISWITSH